MFVAGCLKLFAPAPSSAASLVYRVLQRAQTLVISSFLLLPISYLSNFAKPGNTRKYLYLPFAVENSGTYDEGMTKHGIQLK